MRPSGIGRSASPLAEKHPVLLGPDGRPVIIETKDFSAYEPKPGEGMTISPKDTLVKGARMLRDGWTIGAINRELQLINVPNPILERALVTVGMPLLEQRIAAGEEPAESVVRMPVPVGIDEIKVSPQGTLYVEDDDV